MEPYQIQSAIQSRTVQLILASLIAYAVKNFGIQFAPVELQLALTEVLTVAIPILMTAAMWFRIKATTIIKGWWE
jgi:hypothetical protein